MYSVRRCFASVLSNIRPINQSQHAKHTLPDMPYPYDSLEPIICKEIMELHHQKHHQAYVTNLNAAEEKLQEAIQKKDTSSVIALQNALRFNGGGHINHSIFWNNLTPQSTKLEGELLELVKTSFGSEECMKDKLASAGNAVQGSGWAWLGYNSSTGCLGVYTTANQDPLLATHGVHPLLGIDVWEHAYYLQYLNKRPDYTKAIFEVVNWNDVNERYLDAKCGIAK